MRTISVKLCDDVFAQLAKKARIVRVTKSHLVRKSLEKILAKEPPIDTVSCFDLARDPAGSVKRLPRDLVRNPKFMDGFGE